MVFLVLVTFVGANLHAILWQQSSWLVSTVLPAVVVDLTNDERQALNAPELRRNTTLDQAAKLKAQHMAANEYFSHYSPEGVSPWYWFDEAGYIYAHAGENLAIHFTDSTEVVEAWMNSPTHRANIVDAKYTEIGVGTARGKYEGYDTVYVVQLFGAPAYTAPVEPVEIETPEVTDTVKLAELAQTLSDLEVIVQELSEPELALDETEVPEVLAETDDEVIEEMVIFEPEFDVTASAPQTEVEIPPLQIPDEIVVVESSIATSSGLAVASISDIPSNQAGTTVVSMITKPNDLLQGIYMFLGLVVMLLLFSSAIFEARKLHFVQVSYSIGLMISMGALWYIHALLTNGAVIA